MPLLSVAENIFAGRQQTRWPGRIDRRAMRTRAAALIEQLGVAHRPRPARRRPRPGAEPDRRDRQGAVAGPPPPDPRRADGGAHPDRDRAPVRHRPLPGAQGRLGDLRLAPPGGDLRALRRRHRAQGRPARRNPHGVRDHARRADPADGRARRRAGAQRPQPRARRGRARGRAGGGAALGALDVADRARRRDRLPRRPDRLGPLRVLRDRVRRPPDGRGPHPARRARASPDRPLGRHGARGSAWCPRTARSPGSSST